MPRSVHTDEYAAMTKVIVAVRLEQGLTQAEVAERLKRPQSYVSKLERGERRIDLVELFELSHALRVLPATLVQRIFSVLPRPTG